MSIPSGSFKRKVMVEEELRLEKINCDIKQKGGTYEYMHTMETSSHKKSRAINTI